VHSATSNFFTAEKTWEPYSGGSLFECDGDLCITSMGCYGGDCISQTFARERTSKSMGSINDVSNGRYDVTFHPADQTVVFTLNGNKRGAGTLEADKMLAKHHDTAVLVFGVGIGVTPRTVKLTART
jgi:hypothetical protein